MWFSESFALHKKHFFILSSDLDTIFVDNVEFLIMEVNNSLLRKKDARREHNISANWIPLGDQ